MNEDMLSCYINGGLFADPFALAIDSHKLGEEFGDLHIAVAPIKDRHHLSRCGDRIPRREEMQLKTRRQWLARWPRWARKSWALQKTGGPLTMKYGVFGGPATKHYVEHDC